MSSLAEKVPAAFYILVREVPTEDGKIHLLFGVTALGVLQSPHETADPVIARYKERPVVSVEYGSVTAGLGHSSEFAGLIASAFASAVHIGTLAVQALHRPLDDYFVLP